MTGVNPSGDRSPLLPAHSSPTPARQAISDAAPLLSSTTAVGGTRSSYGGSGGGATVIGDGAPVVDLPRSDVVRRELSAAGRRFAPACT
nr:hypothetical protein Itr_chr02CG10160 [Ipomoea trifida]GLL19556.1 hypothetical protein Itr_chr02CG10170 [Ipomoea trifida]